MFRNTGLKTYIMLTTLLPCLFTAEPDTSQYEWDAASGYYYDHTTGLYYDANSQVKTLTVFCICCFPDSAFWGLWTKALVGSCILWVLAVVVPF